MSNASPNADIPMPLPDAIANARTLPEMFRARVALTPDAIAYQQYEPGAAGWVDWTWRGTSERVDRWRRILAGEQVSRSARASRP